MGVEAVSEKTSDVLSELPPERQITGLPVGAGTESVIAIIGWGRSGQACARVLSARGLRVAAWDQKPSDALVDGVELTVEPDLQLLADSVMAAEPGLIVVSPGIPQHTPIFEAASAASIPLIGEVELAWRLQEAGEHAGRPWLCVTGTNGKTTTVGMLGSILRAAGENVLEVGNIGTPIVEAVDSDATVFAVELSSFQLYTTSTLSPEASVCLNVDADHVDWHGSVSAYAAAKARIYENTQIACVYPSEDRAVERMVANADVIEGARAIGITLGTPAVSQIGLVEGALVDRAFVPNRQKEAAFLADLTDLTVGFGPQLTPAVVSDALAAAALARAHGVEAEAVAQGLRNYQPAGHRRALVAYAADMAWINDSKATNAHAAVASLVGIPKGTAIWIAGGDTKGQDLNECVAQVADRLRGVVLIGEDRSVLRDALNAQAPHIPVVEVDGHEDWMFSVVNEAVALSRPGDTVVLAPAAASWDQFASYSERGEAFVDAVRRLAEQWQETQTTQHASPVGEPGGGQDS